MALAYLDTCVWLSAFHTKDWNHTKAVEALEKVKNGDYIAIITHHVLNEILDVMKTEAVVSTKNESKAEALARQMYGIFSQTLLRLPNVLIKNPHVSAQNVFRPSFSLLFKHLRGMSQSSNCPICRSNFPFVEPDTIFRDDAVHAMLAWLLNCDVFVTFDKDFLKLSNEPLLHPMKIEVVK
jgi:predicted nucleic acid-binding protein